MTRTLALSLLLAATLLSVAPATLATELHVDQTGGLDSNDGSTWSQALLTITRALEIAVISPEADTIHVAEGLYRERVEIGLSGMTLLGGYPTGGGTRDPAAHETVIEGNREWPTVVVSGMAGAVLLDNITIDGFTLARGASWERALSVFGGGGIFVEEAAVVITNNVIRDSLITGGSKGGGLYLFRKRAGASLVRDNVISGNLAEDAVGAGAVIIDLADPATNDPIVFERNQVLDNRAVALTDIDDLLDNEANGQGGGLWIWGGATIVADNIFSGNVAEEANDHDFQGQGGGLYVIDAAPVITGNIIENNRAIGLAGRFTGSGGGLYVLSTSDDVLAGATIDGNAFRGNSAEGGLGDWEGAGAGALLSLFGSGSPVISNNVFESNGATGGANSSARGGGLYAYLGEGYPSSILVSGGRVTGNQAESAGGGIWLTAFDGGDAVVENLDIEANESDVASGMMAFGNLEVRHSTIRGNRLYDPDADEVSEIRDNCPGLSNPVQRDADLDGLGDACDDDDDDDGVIDAADNCPLVFNTDQVDVCAGDADGDGLADGGDNCPQVANADQLDSDIPPNGVGDACEPARFDPLETNASGLWMVGDGFLTNLEITGNIGQGLQIIGFPEDMGAGLPEDPSSPLITNLTISENVASGFITYLADGTVMENTIIALNFLSDGFDTELGNGDPSSPNMTCNSIYFGDGVASLPCTGVGNLDYGPMFDQPPRFVPGPFGDFYLEQVAAGGANDSIAVDAGTRAAAGSPVDGLTTRVDAVADAGVVDLGYHYPAQLVPVEDCTNGLDDDGDGAIDCVTGNEDADCPCGPETLADANCADGVDNDGDGLTDSADPDCAAVENCANGLDDDGDGAIDCDAGNEDADCPCGPETLTDANCDDGVDNDGDGLTDASDPDCTAVEDCANGLDDDGDGAVDCEAGNEDADCPCGPETLADANCGDGVDNDGDGLPDGLDPDCAAVEDCANGVDDDGDGAVDCEPGNEDADCPCGPETVADGNCADGVDNDGDGLVDLADPDCAGSEDCANGSDDDGDGDIDCADLDCLLSPLCDGFDYDGDGVVNSDDCDRQDATVWSVPDEVAGLLVSKDPGGVVLAWDSLAAQAGPSTVHDLVGGTIAELHAAGSVDTAQCLRDGEPATNWLDTRPINPDEALYYLVRGETSCGQGPYGRGSAGNARLPAAGDCP